MTISLRPELQRFVEERVRAGEYATADEAVNSLLSFVAQQEELTGEQLEALRRQVAVGIAEADRGELLDWDPKAVWDEVEGRPAREKPWSA
jgi:antitoxin ParD1/3/4